MVIEEKWVVRRPLQGLPKLDDFELVKKDVGPLDEGEIAFRAEFVSVNPSLRSRASPRSPAMPGSIVAMVTESKHPKFSAGQRIIAHCGWVKTGKLNPDVKELAVTPAVDIGSMSLSLLLGACGMPGVTAYKGFLEVCQPKQGETVVVNAAAGAVGSLVGQIAKIKGCRAIGYAGSDEKVEWLKKDLGFDEAFNYKKTTVADSLKAAAPNGVDCFFENVGGEDFNDVLKHMNKFGRVAICGFISSYNEIGSGRMKDIRVPMVHIPILGKELKVEGFMVYRWVGPEWFAAIKQMAAWINEGKIQAKETIMDGFEKTPEAFIGLFTGKNTGKMIVSA